MHVYIVIIAVHIQTVDALWQNHYMYEVIVWLTRTSIVTLDSGRLFMPTLQNVEQIVSTCLY